MKDGENKKNMKSQQIMISQQTNQKAKSNLQTATITVGLCNITDITMTIHQFHNQKSYAL